MWILFIASFSHGDTCRSLFLLCIHIVNLLRATSLPEAIICVLYVLNRVLFCRKLITFSQLGFVIHCP